MTRKHPDKKTPDKTPGEKTSDKKTPMFGRKDVLPPPADEKDVPSPARGGQKNALPRRTDDPTENFPAAPDAGPGEPESPGSRGSRGDQGEQGDRKRPGSLPPGLYVLPSPLGNLSDISPRFREVLSGAGLVAAEDTRRTVKILNHLGLKKTLLSYREENHRSAWPRLQKVLSEGATIALLSDAGSPGVCDPGAALVREARGAGFAVWPVAGPSAVTAALSVCGFEASSFTFLGFLPPGPKARRERIKAAGASGEILVLFVPPHKQTRYLADLADVLGPRPAFLAREMTKLHEEHLALPLPELRDELLSRPRKGEMTLVVGPAKKLGQSGRPLPGDGGDDGHVPPDDAAVREAMDASSSTNEAARKLSQTGGVSKKDAYAMVLRLGAKLGRPAPDDDAEDDGRLEEDDGRRLEEDDGRRLEEDDGRLEEDDD